MVGWRRSPWLALAELVLVVAFVVADTQGLVPFSKTPFYLVLGWISLRLRETGWRQVGFTVPARWPRALALGALAGILHEVLSAFVIEPGLARLLGKSADFSDFRPLPATPRCCSWSWRRTGSCRPSARSSCTAAT